MLKILSIIASFISLASPAKARTIIVNGANNLTIQKAIVLAINGDTVLVNGGVYKEGNIIIRKQIVLKGINNPILDGENKFEIISIKSNNVTIDGFRLQHSGSSGMDDIAAIKIYNAKNISIINNTLDDSNFGIYTQYSANCLIKNNTITAYGKEEMQSGNGIHCFKSDSMYIIANKIKGHRDGIYFEFVTNSLIWRNTSILNVRYGLHFMFSQDDTYISNIFKRNGSGVAVMYSHGVKMFNNYFEDNWGDASYAILLKDITDSYILGNHFKKNTVGIHMEGSSRIQLQRNDFVNNGWAIKIQASCDDNNIEQNNFRGNTFDIGTNGSLVLNKFNGNFWDKYEGYDLNRNKVGDIAYHPVSLYSMVIDNNPAALMLFRSLIVILLDKSEKIIPTITPENLKDTEPLMYPLSL